MSKKNNLSSEIASALRLWICRDAAPFWAKYGVDRVKGGFFEGVTLSPDFAPLDAPRRARLVSRQIYFFAASKRLGWDGSADEIIEHGFSFLVDHFIAPDGRVLASCNPDGEVIDGRLYLYDVAFVLFALANVYQVFEGAPQGEKARNLAKKIADYINTHNFQPSGGYFDDSDKYLRCANPHMHLFEAFLYWYSKCGGDYWKLLADTVGNLAVEKMVTRHNGAIPEYFDDHWRPLVSEGFIPVEPGHQFEWSWLLSRWSKLTQSNSAAAAAADKLAEIGERFGVDPMKGVAVNCMDINFEITDCSAKVWPQTERAKAWHEQAVVRGCHKSAAMRDEALKSLHTYLSRSRKGVWYEVMDHTGALVDGPVKASTAYHLVCAIETVCGVYE